VCSYPACNAHAPFYVVTCGVCGSNIIYSTLLLLLFIIIGIQPLGRSGQRPEISQATGMALVRWASS